MDYCKSNKKNQFKDIKLQLHAIKDPIPNTDIPIPLSKKVSNPYTFSIQGNKSFSGSCTLSDVDTVLFNGNISMGNSIKITVPNDVKVLYVYVKYGNLSNKNTNINWSRASFNDNNMSYTPHSNYVGVTPNKTYTLLASEWYYESNGSISVNIKYSSSINNSKVFTKDY